RAPRRDGLAVGLELRRFLRRLRRPPRIRLCGLESARRFVADLRERTFRLVGGQRLAVPAFLVLDERHALALHGTRDDRRRTLGVARACERVVGLGEVVSVDDEDLPAERLDARGIGIGVPLQLGRAALAETV